MVLSSRLPELFLERLASIIPSESQASVIATFAALEPVCVRINTLKSGVPPVVNHFVNCGFSTTALLFTPEAFILDSVDGRVLHDDPLIAQGFIYRQAPSSLLPAVVLGTRFGESVLDACAAPGSKTTQIAALMQGQGEILAVESVKGRFYKLRSVCDLLGAKNVRIKLSDARRLRFDVPIFDKVLVDAPCSSEGRFKVQAPKSFAYWSERKIKEMSHKQKGILLNCARGLKKGGRLVYSTCTFAPEENEEVIDWFLRKTGGNFRLEAVELPGVSRYPVLTSWKSREYQNDLSLCLRVLPDAVFSAFFIASLKREG